MNCAVDLTTNWAIDQNNTTQHEVWADSWKEGGITVTVAITTGGELSVTCANRVEPIITQELIRFTVGDDSEVTAAELYPSVSDCGNYLYVKALDYEVHVKLEGEGLVADIYDAGDECVDTASVLYAEILDAA